MGCCWQLQTAGQSACLLPKKAAHWETYRVLSRTSQGAQCYPLTDCCSRVAAECVAAELTSGKFGYAGHSSRLKQQARQQVADSTGVTAASHFTCTSFTSKRADDISEHWSCKASKTAGSQAPLHPFVSSDVVHKLSSHAARRQPGAVQHCSSLLHCRCRIGVEAQAGSACFAAVWHRLSALAGMHGSS